MLSEKHHEWSNPTSNRARRKFATVNYQREALEREQPMKTYIHKTVQLGDLVVAGFDRAGRRQLVVRPSTGVLALLAVVSVMLAACTSSTKPGSSALLLTVLGTAEAFTVLGGSTVISTGPTTVVGNLGVSPASAVVGFPPGTVTGGVIHASDAVALQAQQDVTTAYNTLAGQACDHDLTGQDLGGLTLTPGVYCFSSAAQLTGTLTLNAQGNPDSVFVFQIVSTLTTASGAAVAVINGAQLCNAFWQVGSSAILGTTTTFGGNILALTSITLATGVQVFGRALARNGAVTMDTNHVEVGTCVVGGAVVDASAVDARAADSGAADQPNGDSGADAGLGDARPSLDAALVDAPVVDAAVVDAALVDAVLADGGAVDGGICCVGVACGTACVDLTVDSNNCGSCGHTCSPSQLCSDGACVTCDTLCAGACVNLDYDHDNCSSCGHVCSSSETCSGGSCVPCPNGTVCGGSCANFQTDFWDCGSCGHTCSPSEVCSGGSCVPCRDGTACAGSCVNFQTDSFNCGSCGNACGPGASCTSGACTCGQPI